MQISLIDEYTFDEYASNHANCNYYQSSSYGKFMTKHGYNSYYIALYDENNIIKAATLIIVKNQNNDKRKMGYAPRGFLIDWNDFELIKIFTDKLIEFLKNRSFTYLKIDPNVIYKEYDINKNELYNNSEFVKKMQNLGYIHMGYNDGYEALKPRWNTIIELDIDSKNLYNSLSKNARNKIKSSIISGNKVYKGTINDIDLFYSIINKKNPPLDYYLDLYEFFGNNLELYFVKMEPVEFVKKTKQAYENEEKKNNELNNIIQDIHIQNKEDVLNKKIKSDELLNGLKIKLDEAINMFQNHPNGIVIATCLVIKFGKCVTFFTSGCDKTYINNYPEYLLRWQLTDEFSKQGFKIIDSNGLSGKFTDEYFNLLKRELSNKIIEYVGEFDLVLNKKSYYTGNKLNPILNWLNSPI